MARSTRGSAKKSATPPPAPAAPPQHSDSEAPSEVQEVETAPDTVVQEIPATTPTRTVVNIFGGHLTEELRQAIIQKHENEPDLSQVQLTDWLEKTYGVKVNRTTVGRTIQKAMSGARGRQRPVKSQPGSPSKTPKKLDLDQAVYDWYLDKAKSLDTASAQNGTPPVLAFGVHTFREKASELAATGLYDMPPKAKFTDPWLKSFLKRFNLQVTALPVYEDGTAVGDESNTAAANIEGGSARGSEDGKWPDELRPYLAPTDGDDDDDSSESGRKKKRVVVATETPLLGTSFRWNSAQHVTEEMRLALAKKREEEPSISQHQLAGWLNATYGVRVHRATVGRNLKRLLQESGGCVSVTSTEGEADPEDELQSAPKRAKMVVIARDAGEKEAVHPASLSAPEAFESDLSEWWNLERSSGTVPTDKQLLEKARELKRVGEYDLPATFTLSAAWRNSFKRRHSISEEKGTETGKLVGNPTMPEVHRSVNLIRTYVFNANYDQDTKKELMQGLDDIYIKMGEANRKAK